MDHPRAGVRGGAARRRRRSDRGDRPAPARRTAQGARAVSAGSPRPATTIGLAGAPRGARSPFRRPWRRSSRSSSRCGSGLGLGLRDYVTKNGFCDVVLRGSRAGSTRRPPRRSGPTRSARNACTRVSMQSRFSSGGTRDDAREVSENLGVDFREIPIEGGRRSVPRRALGGLGGGLAAGEPPGADPRGRC